MKLWVPRMVGPESDSQIFRNTPDATGNRTLIAPHVCPGVLTMAHVLDPPPTVTQPCPVRTALGDPDTLRKILIGARIFLSRRKSYSSKLELDSDAEDLAAEAQAKALAKASSFDPTRLGSVAVWIRGFVQNIAMRNYATTRKHRSDPAVHLLIDPTESVEDRFSREADRAAVRGALGLLDSLNRRILELTFFDRLKSEEIADVVGLTAANVRVKLYRAKKELFQLLSPSLRGGPS